MAEKAVKWNMGLLSSVKGCNVSFMGAQVPQGGWEAGERAQAVKEIDYGSTPPTHSLAV